MASTLPTSRVTKRSVLLALLAGVLVVGAIVGGVFGGRAAAKKRRTPIPVEAVTYSMVAEGFAHGALVPSPKIYTDTAAGSPANATTTATMTPTTTADKAPAGTGLGGQPSVFSWDYWFGNGGIGAVPMFDPSPLVIPPGAVTVPTWSAALTNGNFPNTQGRVVCYAKNGQDVMDMVSGDASACEVIILTNDRFTPYSISKTLNITKPKLLIGRPIYPPMLNCTNHINRLFDVLPGGRLEARNVIMVRGYGTNIGLNGNEINLNVGTIVRVQLGGQFSATACMFRERNNTLPTFLSEVRRKIQTPTARNRQFGQMILVLGGRLVLNGCYSIRFRPFGNGILNTMVIGRDINVVAGACTLIGHNSASASLWSVNYFMTGAVATVMGGVLTFIGGNNIGANWLQVQGGTMVNFGTFAGTMVTIGYGYTTVKGMLFRSIAGQFGTIAGVSIQVAFVRGSADAIKFQCGAGGTHATIIGINNRHSGAETGYSICGFFAGLGGANYVSAGTNFVQAIPRIGTYLTASSNGAGLASYIGAGTSTNSYTGQLSVQMMRFNAGAATDLFCGAGWHTNINATRFSIQLANSFVGVGNQLYVGLGGAVFIRTYSLSSRVYQFNPSTRFTYTVAGMGVSSSGTRGQNLVVTKGGATRYMFNKTDGTVTKYAYGVKPQKTRSPTHAPGTSKWDKKRQALVRKRAVQATDIGADVPATMASWLKTIVDAAGGVDPSLKNKVVVLQSTIIKKQMLKPPHPSQFRGRKMQEHFGGYAKILADGLVDMDFGDRDDREAVESPGLISANNSDCFLCNVNPGNTADHIGGPGACEINDVCGSSSNPAEIYASAQNATATDIRPPYMDKSMGKVDADGNPVIANTWMLWHELVVYCRSSNPETDDSSIKSNCLSADFIKDVVRSYIMMDSTKNEYQITVSDANIHAAVDAFPDPTLEELKAGVTPQWNQECQGWSKYDIRLVASDPEAEQHILDVMQSFVEDPTDLQTTILENADPDADLQPCAITITEKGETRIPSLQKMPAFKPSQAFTLGPDVVIADGVSIEPVRFLSPGETYTVYVQNFPKGSKIDLKLMDGLADGRKLMGGLADAGPAVASISSFDDDGISEVRWTVPKDIPMDGRKRYLKAEINDIPALFAFSQVFYLETKNAM